MVQVSRFKSLAAGVLFALGAASSPVLADDAMTNLGPVGPREPLLVKVGEQRFVAFYTKERGECAVSAVTWKDADPDEPGPLIGPYIDFADATEAAMEAVLFDDADVADALASAQEEVTASLERYGAE